MTTVRQQACASLAQLIERQALRYGHYTPIDGVLVSRFVSPTEPITTVMRPVYSVILQGMKEAMIGSGLVRYHAGQSLIAGVDLPVTSRILEASNALPYLSISIEIDRSILLELLAGQAAPAPDAPHAQLFETSQFDPRLADPLARLLELIDYPEGIPVLTPLIQREILWRLLQGPFSAVLRQLAWPQGDVGRIGRATSWIRNNHAQPLRIAELAALVNMSAPSLHRHFRSITSVSPLQFQKHVRLHLARRRVLAAEGIGIVAHDVGYDSLSQFNRDYRKLYGVSPSQDLAALRHQAG